jgi:hypothetical protein
LLREARSSTASYDERKAFKLWNDSEELVQLNAAAVQQVAYEAGA